MHPDLSKIFDNELHDSFFNKMLNPCPSHLSKATSELTCRWMLAMLKSSLREGMFPAPLREALDCPFLKESLMDPAVLEIFSPNLSPSLFKEGLWEGSDIGAPEDPGWNRLSGALSVGFQPQIWNRDAFGWCLIGVTWGLHPSCLFLTGQQLLIYWPGYPLGQLQQLGMWDTVLCWFASFFQGWSQLVFLGRKRSSPSLASWGLIELSVLSTPF